MRFGRHLASGRPRHLINFHSTDTGAGIGTGAVLARARAPTGNFQQGDT
ncbi:hypothetical protein BVI434_180029 [Burkholderia vietnamiensis]|nr:hypothetical protein BVI434_180029 [Burkholderia vietnamiensis]